jgi:hypothetical protein
MVYRSAWFVVIALITVACLDEPDCFSLNNYIVGISFKKLSNSRADTVAFTGIGTIEPPIRFSDDTLISRMALPLNYFEDETSFFFTTADRTHILRLGYTSQAQFVSENCGERFVLSQLRVLSHSFDSVRLVTDRPSRAGGTIHLEIFQ